jgi:hypothetical protein
MKLYNYDMGTRRSVFHRSKFEEGKRNNRESLVKAEMINK